MNEIKIKSCDIVANEECIMLVRFVALDMVVPAIVMLKDTHYIYIYRDDAFFCNTDECNKVTPKERRAFFKALKNLGV